MTMYEIRERASIRCGKELAEDKGPIDDIDTVCTHWRGTDRSVRDEMQARLENDWQFERSFSVKNLKPKFDMMCRDICGLEREKGWQMHIRSHLLFAEAAHQQDIVEMLALIVPVRAKNGNFDRTLRELGEDLFTKYFKLEVPIYLVGFAKANE